MAITKRRIFVIECKNLYGDITINNNGDFIRSYANRKEGIYSPITQCQRHLELIREMRLDDKNNIITKWALQKYFYETYRSVVVLSNPRSIVSDRYAPKEIRQQVIRSDRLTQYIKKINQEKNAEDSFESQTQQLAEYFLATHKKPPINYHEKYLKLSNDNNEKKARKELVKIDIKETNPNSSTEASVPACPKCGAVMILRTAKRGENAGREFWGCPNYPKSRGLVNIDR